MFINIWQEIRSAGDEFSLIKLTKEGKLLSREFVKKKLDAVKKREEMSGPYLGSSRASKTDHGIRKKKIS